MNSFASFLRDNRRSIVLVLVLVSVSWLVWQLRAVLLPFALGGLFAWLIQPVLHCLERRLPANSRLHEFNRVAVVIVIYLASAALLALIIYYAVVVLGRSVATLIAAAPQLIPQGVAAIEQSMNSFLTSLPPSVRVQMEALISQGVTRGGQVLIGFVTAGFARIGGSSSTILGFVALPVFIFYVLKDWGRLREDFYHALPAWTMIHVRSVCSIVYNVAGRYIRGALFLGVAVGLATYVLLAVLRVPYAVPLAVFGGIGEVIPLIGPWMAGIIGVLVVLATAPDKILWVGLGYVAIQLFENHLLVPRIQGRQMHIHPAIVIVLTIVAGARAGILGFILALPLTATIIELFKYVQSQRQQNESVQD